MVEMCVGGGSMESNVVVDGNNDGNNDDDGCGDDGKSIVVVSVYSKASLRWWYRRMTARIWRSWGDTNDDDSSGLDVTGGVSE